MVLVPDKSSQVVNQALIESFGEHIMMTEVGKLLIDRPNILDVIQLDLLQVLFFI